MKILWFSKEPTDNFTAYNGAIDAVATISGKHVLISSKKTAFQINTNYTQEQNVLTNDV